MVIDISQETRPVLIMGDTHTIGHKLQEKLSQLKDVVVILMGDTSLGFDHQAKEGRNLDRLQETCERNNINFLLFRGNHCDPSYFKVTKKVRPNITLLADYTYIESNVGLILCIGGGISIDRIARKPGIDYWEDEAVVLKPELCHNVDILLTHVPPSWIGPFGINAFVAPYAKGDKTLAAELKEERAIIDKLVELCQPVQMYSGHMHEHSQRDFNGCRFHILDIFEIQELKP